ncbi:FAD-dependent monooxygenase [Streptomyces sp. DW26H14]|uniref:FAD-dependent monooxygenase n=1 Tax=Streptomyces sp. DW26H14 TaxID=3435395 RepID=UPI00403DBCFA
MADTAPRVAVVGGGPGGLTLARVLQVHGVPVTVFERDASPSARPPGGTLDLHPGTGQAALAAAGLTEAFRALSRPEGEEVRVSGADGRVLVHHEPTPGVAARPEIDRGDLRTLLLDSLAGGTVRWGHALTGIVPGADGRSRLVFAGPGSGAGAGNGTETGAGSGPGAEIEAANSTGAEDEAFDLVVGADGAWSRTRAHLGGAVPAFSGVHLIEARVEAVDARAAAVTRLVGDGSLYAFEAGLGIMAQRNTQGVVRVYFTLREPEGAELYTGGALTSPDTARAALRERFAGWSPALLALLDACGDVFQHRPLYTLAPGRNWPARPGITLLGDAAHLMTPFAGMGANLAMLDGAELGEAVAREASVRDAVERYERDAVPRGSHGIEMSARGLAACMSQGAPGSAVAYLSALG